jgi:DNA processing protein
MGGQLYTGEREEYLIQALSLRALKGLGDRGYKLLIDAFGTPERALVEGPGVLSRQGDGAGEGCARLAHLLKRTPNRKNARWVLEESKRAGCRIICYGDEQYPELLAEIHDPPAHLFVVGEFAPLRAVAMVGSRKATTFARRTARRMAEELASSNFSVVSGFAQGVDTEAHRGALEGHGHTVAVLGSGVDVIYPRRNTELAGKVIAAGGAIISEHPPGTEPLPQHFPRRNRIISGLSQGVVVVEAARRSGSLITAKTALEQGREVFAVPGLAGSSSSEGTHNLIRQGAVLTETAEDVLRELNTAQAVKSPIRKDRVYSKVGGAKVVPLPLEEVAEPPVALDLVPSDNEAVAEVEADEAALMLEVLEEAPLDIETLIERSGLTAGTASAALMELILVGRAQEWPGKLYCKLN